MALVVGRKVAFLQNNLLEKLTRQLKGINMVKYELIKKENLAYVRNYETSDPSKSHAVFVCAAFDLPQLENIFRKGFGKVSTYKYTLRFNKGWLTIRYTWNKAFYKKVRIDNLRNLIRVLSKATSKKESPVKRWLKKWVLSEGKRL